MAQFNEQWRAMQERARNNKKKWIYISLAGVVVVGGIVIWQLNKKSKGTKGQTDYDAMMNPTNTDSANKQPNSTNKQQTATPKTSNQLPPVTKPDALPEYAPLNVGSKNPFVGQLQYALNDLYAAGLTTDSIFGAKTKAVLDKQGIKLPLNQDDYYEIVDKYLIHVGTNLLTYGKAGNYAECKKLLSTMLLPYDYTAVSNVFKKSNFIGDTPMTLVTGMLRAFTTQTQQKTISDQFKRMGLVESADGKWSVPSLSGLDQFNVLTLTNTALTLSDNTLIPVEKAVMLGRMTAMDASYVYVENNGQQMKVPWETVKVLA